MKHLDLLNEFRIAMSQLAAQVEAASAMQMYDIHKVSENLILGVLRELYEWRQLRNLNSTERANFPGIDLADDVAGVAVQVTATPTLDKIKSTIETFLAHGLDKKYRRVVVYVLGRKQASYSQDAIDRAANGRFKLDTATDILDYRDVCGIASHVDPKQLVAALEVVRTYLRGGVARGLGEEDFNPLTSPPERVNLNLVEVYFPSTLYIAELSDDLEAFKSKKVRNERKTFGEAVRSLNLRVPSDYEVSGRQLITFHQLDDKQGPFAQLIELGTVTPLQAREFYGANEDRERVFKSLLRFTMQQKLYKHGVRWMHEDSLFIFVPWANGDLLREENWVGQRASKRAVYERKLNKKDPNKTFLCKHLAFAADFIFSAGRWYVALTPDWYFSFGDNFRRSAFADANLSWLKRKEVNSTVAGHFRFLTAWLSALDQDDLFESIKSPAATLSLGETVSFSNHPALLDDTWLPLRDESDDSEEAQIFGLFDKL
ncbi:SMEK domain-containing protein [Variovorax ureilyticus]|uniref:SMEK domain-containing protein n=1 Tax=Variovorax ureilyticus TaxID=1836198 RepID=A0ABU8VMQ0_9BURK